MKAALIILALLLAPIPALPQTTTAPAQMLPAVQEFIAQHQLREPILATWPSTETATGLTQDIQTSSGIYRFLISLEKVSTIYAYHEGVPSSIYQAAFVPQFKPHMPLYIRKPDPTPRLLAKKPAPKPLPIVQPEIGILFMGAYYQDEYGNSQFGLIGIGEAIARTPSPNPVSWSSSPGVFAGSGSMNNLNTSATHPPNGESLYPTTHVRGYTRSDGTYVRPHTRALRR